MLALTLHEANPLIHQQAPNASKLTHNVNNIHILAALLTQLLLLYTVHTVSVSTVLFLRSFANINSLTAALPTHLGELAC